jgi:hypothetical protein
MHLAFVMTQERGATDRLLSAFAAQLAEQGVRLAGIVQTNTECADQRLCDMDVKVLPDGETIRISQSLGPEARGCRLDTSALEQAVGLVTESLSAETPPALLVVNKFGKHEADGRGMRPVIGEAMARDIPVLTGVNGLNREKFEAYCEGMAVELSPTLEALTDWFAQVTAARESAAE